MLIRIVADLKKKKKKRNLLIRKNSIKLYFLLKKYEIITTLQILLLPSVSRPVIKITIMGGCAILKPQQPQLRMG